MGLILEYTWAEFPKSEKRSPPKAQYEKTQRKKRGQPRRKIRVRKWSGGVFYTSDKKQAWRVLAAIGDRVDKAVPWGSTKKSKEKAFVKACQMILKARSEEAAS